MAIQTASTTNLDKAQNTVIAMARYTAESATPCQNTIENFTLSKGQSTLTIPKVGQVTFQALTDGVDLTDEADIGLTYTDLTTSEIGAKFILTKKLVRQFNEDVFKMVGRQLGDGRARYVDNSIISLFSGFSNGLGADGATLGLSQASACTVYAFSQLFPQPISVVHHPNAIGTLGRGTAAIGQTYYAGIMQGLSEKLLRNFFQIQISGVNFLWDANIAKIGTTDSGYGAIYSKSAMAMLHGWDQEVDREYDASLRGWEVVMTQDYGVYEIDDAYGASMRYEIGNLVTT